MLRRILAGTVLFIVCVVFMSGCEKSADSDTLQNSDSQKTKESVLQIGQAGKTDTFEISVTKVDKAIEWTKTPAEGREYIIVSVKVKNISKEEESVGVSDFQYVSDKSGNREAYENYSGVKTDPDTFGAANIAPGDSFEGSIVYSMPKDMTKIELHYTEGYSLNPALRFEFSK